MNLTVFLLLNINSAYHLATTEHYKSLIKAEAHRLGFLSCGFAKAQKLDDDARRLEDWLKKGYHAGMEYMERNFDLRTDPTLLVPGAKSVITLLYNYFPAQQQPDGLPKIARYAYGKDYHYVVKQHVQELLQYIELNIGAVEARCFVDSAPVLERSWALRSGLGWIGKNSNLLTRHSGSYFFIATLISDLELPSDDPFPTDHCGTCTRCIDACPTNAITDSGEIISEQCISYQTIELKDAMIADDLGKKMNGWIFGCDICQEVCPWNRFSKPTNDPRFTATPELMRFTLADWQQTDQTKFNKIFKNTPLQRAKWKGIQRNLKAAYMLNNNTER